MTSMKPILLLAAAAAFVGVSAAKAGSAARHPLTVANGRADYVTCPTLPGPSPSPGTSGKIVEVPTVSRKGGSFFSTLQCGGAGYTYRANPQAPPTLTKLKLARGATALRVYDIDAQGETVGAMYFPKGIVLPYRWNAAGTPTALPAHSIAAATALGKAGGLPIVGEALNPQGVFQGFWFEPEPTFFIRPDEASTINDVVRIPGSNSGVYVGQLKGFAAAGIGAKGLALLPIGHPSNALAINDSFYIVGHATLSGGCGSLIKGSGFGFQYPQGQLLAIRPLDGDCDSSMLDVSDTRAAVGFSTRGLLGTQRAEGYNVPNLPKGLEDLNATTAFSPAGEPPPWIRKGHRLIAATGIDAEGDIAATDSAGVVWFLEQ
jgi:hypothetical protein